MNCPQCSSGITPDARFCSQCGTKLAAEPAAPAPDPRAQTSPSDHAESLRRLIPPQYLDKLRNARGALAGERRVVTLLFADVTGSTQLEEHLDPEDVMDLMNGAFEAMIEPIFRHEGTLARLMGDAVLAFFGAPIAHDDDAARACRAGLDIVAAIRQYAARVERESGLSGLDVRVGIHTGLVVVGEVGSDLRMEYSAMGDAANLASRIQNAAEPGSVWVSSHTMTLAHDEFAFDDLGPVNVKGRSEPVRTYRLRERVRDGGRRGGDTGSAPGTHGAGDTKHAPVPMVGRDEELSRLRDALESVREGRGGAVAVVGEGGIGKSRLVGESLTAMPEDVETIELRCFAHARDSSHAVIRQLLNTILGIEVTHSPSDAVKVLRINVTRLDVVSRGNAVEFAGPDGLPPYAILEAVLDAPLENAVKVAIDRLGAQEHARWIEDAFCAYLISISRVRPIVILCEDAHYGDPSSIQLLWALARRAAREAIRVVFVFRPGDSPVGETHRRAVDVNAPWHVNIPLERLAPDAAADLVRALVDDADVPAYTRRVIVESGNGNPFFLQEVTKAVVDGALVDARAGQDGRWSGMDVPNTLNAAVMARIDQLPGSARVVLQTASVMGRVFQREVLTALLEDEMTKEEVGTALEALCERGLLRMRRGPVEINDPSQTGIGLGADHVVWRSGILEALSPGYSFGHSLRTTTEFVFNNVLTADVAYASLLKSRRRELHRTVADTLRRLFPDRENDLAPVLAFHYDKARESERAAHYLVESAQRAAGLNATSEAAALYRRALEAAPPTAVELRERAQVALRALGHH